MLVNLGCVTLLAFGGRSVALVVPAFALTVTSPAPPVLRVVRRRRGRGRPIWADLQVRSRRPPRWWF
jgi:hypothetical protein